MRGQQLTQVGGDRSCGLLTMVHGPVNARQSPLYPEEAFELVVGGNMNKSSLVHNRARQMLQARFQVKLLLTDPLLW